MCFHPQTLVSPHLFPQPPARLHPAALMLASSSDSCLSQARKAPRQFSRFLGRLLPSLHSYYVEMKIWDGEGGLPDNCLSPSSFGGGAYCPLNSVGGQQNTRGLPRCPRAAPSLLLNPQIDGTSTKVIGKGYLLCPASKSNSVVEKRVPLADSLKFTEGTIRKY